MVELQKEVNTIEGFRGTISDILFYSESLLISASGPKLIFYNLKEKKIVKEVKVLNSWFKIVAIRALEQQEGKIVEVRGEKELKWFKIGENLDGELVYQTGILQDKIITSQLVNKQELQILTAHNMLTTYSFPSTQLLRQTFCKEECILYCGDIHPETGLIASGTVFRQIVLWQETLEEPLQVLLGHSGVLFELKFASKEELMSTSDDRTVKIWRQQEGREWEQVFSFEGHTARVWRVLYLESLDLYASVGEDAQCFIWHKHKQCVEKLKGHIGRNAWALAHKGSQIATGGDDGALKVWNLQHILNMKKDDAQNVHQIRLPQAQEPKLMNKPHVNKIRALKVKKIENEVSVICVTGFGSVFKITESQSDVKSTLDLNLLFQDEQKRPGWDVMIIDEFSFISYGEGQIVVLRHDQVVLDQKLSDIKVLNIMVVKREQKSIDFILANGKPELLIYRAHVQDDRFEVQQLSRNWIETSKAQFSCLAFHDNFNTLIIGDTKGSMHIFDYLKEGLPIESLKAHKNERIISLTIQDDKLYSCSRDNYVNEYRLNYEQERTSKISILQKEKEEQLSQIHQVQISETQNTIVGFHSNNIFIIDKLSQIKLFSLDIKGGNKPVDCLIDPKNNFALAFSFGDCLKFCNKIPKEEQEVQEIGFNLEESLHGREILAVKQLKEDLIVTGSEDGLVKVSKVEGNQLKILKSFSLHTGSVRSISVSQPNPLEQTWFFYSSGSKMLANKFIVKQKEETFQINHLCSFNQIQEEQDFRIMASTLINKENLIIGISNGDIMLLQEENEEKKNNSKKKLQSTLLSQQKGTSVLSMASQGDLVAVGYSNGHVALFQLSEDEAEKKLAQLVYYQSHDFGVNAIDIKLVQGESDQVLIVSGGDAQELSLDHIEIKERAKVKGQNKIKAHFSVIKGVKFIGQVQVISSSYDQRVNYFTIQEQNSFFSLKGLKSKRTCLSDLNSLDVSAEGRVLLCGQGLYFVN